MLDWARAQFDRTFSEARHQEFLSSMSRQLSVPIEFRLSETPCFFSQSLMQSLVDAAQVMTEQLLSNHAYRVAADAIVPEQFRLAHGETLPTCVQVDFGLVRTASGKTEGRLVELQAFPSLYGFQMVLAETALAHLQGPETGVNRLTPYLDGLDHESYVALMRRVLVGEHDPAHVVLLEVVPERQKTRPDFVATEATWGIRAIDTSEVIREGRRLFYRRDGVRTPIARIYNRVIPDELERSGATLAFDYRDDLDVQWIGGPGWFFRISKFSLPWLDHPWVPETRFLSDVPGLPPDRDQWILKPLFSFAGGGILFSPTDDDVAAIPIDQRHLYVLQRRVSFTPVIRTPHGDTQAELRIMMVRDAGRYRAVLTLVRMGRGKMMGVDHNKGLAFVGASAGLVG
ncbi:MAG: hypothetical protein HQ485_09850 [Acidobacteria bacterium]|nr:hypothetical protein [Acidobacteriota bacterium]